jgi:hypothetical protein
VANACDDPTELLPVKAKTILSTQPAATIWSAMMSGVIRTALGLQALPDHFGPAAGDEWSKSHQGYDVAVRHESVDSVLEGEQFFGQREMPSGYFGGSPHVCSPDI